MTFPWENQIVEIRHDPALDAGGVDLHVTYVPVGPLDIPDFLRRDKNNRAPYMDAPKMPWTA